MDFLEEQYLRAKHNDLLRKNGIAEPLQDIILYHGSRGGIDGDIAPVSRKRCDFGQGFYLGENKKQAMGLVCEDSDPFFYTIKLKLSKADPKKVWILKDDDWLKLIMSYRRKSEEFNKLEISKEIIERASRYDIIIGPIADDRMNYAFSSFNDYSLTDEGLRACLQYIDYGNQYVLKTPDACRLCEILEEKELKGSELANIQEYTYSERKKARDVVSEMRIKHQRDGYYLNEIVEREKRREQHQLERNDHDR